MRLCFWLLLWYVFDIGVMSSCFCLGASSSSSPYLAVLSDVAPASCGSGSFSVVSHRHQKWGLLCPLIPPRFLVLGDFKAVALDLILVMLINMGQANPRRILRDHESS
ncbi:unnamed protein product [Thlaspi arvense]|uniref:Secreted protein n=1 Tax=Thlaspi arvense TaxID=13288 RepID=A0AAU9T9I3_THLAR|nr:unnamed protein product [Thlaspi arvense]